MVQLVQPERAGEQHPLLDSVLSRSSFPAFATWLALTVGTSAAQNGVPDSRSPATNPSTEFPSLISQPPDKRLTEAADHTRYALRFDQILSLKVEDGELWAETTLAQGPTLRAYHPRFPNGLHVTVESDCFGVQSVSVFDTDPRIENTFSMHFDPHRGCLTFREIRPYTEPCYDINFGTDCSQGALRSFLHVSWTDDGHPKSYELEAGTFSELRLKAPGLFDAFIRPTLRDFGAEDLVRLKPELVAQLLPSGWKISDDAHKIFAKHFPLLDADEWLVRERAEEAISALGVDAFILTRNVDREHLSPEARSRVDTICSRFEVLPRKQLESLRSNFSVLIDCLQSEQDTVRAEAKRSLEELVGEPVQFDPRAKTEERSAQITALRRRLNPDGDNIDYYFEKLPKESQIEMPQLRRAPSNEL